ncbi:MAG: YtrH family sporulation protein [Gorillibacterium sp.]|nr:YtrH family sporulation protein [Gorillibacterium sp.]
MNAFLVKWALDFFIAFGFVLGGSLLAGIGSVLLLQPPASAMESVAANIKIWAMIAAAGGNIDPIQVIEAYFQEGYLSPAIKHILCFVSSFIGAQLGYTLVHWICGGPGGRT